MNLSNSGIKEYWLIFTVLKFPLGLQFSHNLTKFKIIKYISTIYIMTTTCTYLQQLTQVSDVAHGPLVLRNRVLRIVNCCPIHHSLEVSREVDISRARSASNIFTDDCPTISGILRNKSLVSKTLIRL